MSLLADWISGKKRTSLFWVQPRNREAWHIESDEHCEFMLCGLFISVDSAEARIRHAVPSQAVACGECWMQAKARGDGRL